MQKSCTFIQDKIDSTTTTEIFVGYVAQFLENINENILAIWSVQNKIVKSIDNVYIITE